MWCTMDSVYMCSRSNNYFFAPAFCNQFSSPKLHLAVLYYPQPIANCPVKLIGRHTVDEHIHEYQIMKYLWGHNIEPIRMVHAKDQTLHVILIQVVLIMSFDESNQLPMH